LCFQQLPVPEHDLLDVACERPAQAIVDETMAR
jgi:hypothetical protein